MGKHIKAGAKKVILTVPADKPEDVDATVYNMFTIDQVMAKNLITITPETTIRETAEILSKNEFHALPVCDGETLVGIVTTTDLLKYLLEQYN